ncbi:hypothetical protein OSB04_031343 [Centaurea solstitialis]|uniref:VWFA domain-containing protein n=1 Tax=Centaurea solstitialis TaxID=347529 RepID=A0AA38W4N0_9ASTR|nr:hypothetical protein OSB04_031343 [Centaurea solstitialis]
MLFVEVEEVVVVEEEAQVVDSGNLRRRRPRLVVFKNVRRDFTRGVEDGLRLSKRIYFGKDRSVVPPKSMTAMEKASRTLYPVSPMVYAVISNPGIVDNPDVPSYQPHVHGRCDPPALIPLQMNGIGIEGSILGVEVEVTKKSYMTQLVVMDEKGETETIAKPEVKARWSQKIIYKDGEFKLNVPFSFPEYVTPAGKKLSKKEKIQLNINVGLGTQVECRKTSHPLKERKREVGKLAFFYEAEVLTWSSHDFVFTYSVPSSSAFGGVLLQSPSSLSVDQKELFSLYLFPGPDHSRKVGFRSVIRKEVLFVVDISGSMKGRTIDATKIAVIAALSKLDQGDSFSIMAFNDQTYLYSSKMELATKEALNNAADWIGHRDVIWTQAINSDNFFITDGAVENEREICEVMIKRLRNQGSGTDLCPRIYTFGIVLIVLVMLLPMGTYSAKKGNHPLESNPGPDTHSAKLKPWDKGSFYNQYFLQMLAMIGRGHYEAASDPGSSRLCLDYILGNIEQKLKIRPSETKPGHKMRTRGFELGVNGIPSTFPTGLTATPQALWLGITTWLYLIATRMDALFSRAASTVVLNIEIDGLDDIDAFEISHYRCLLSENGYPLLSNLEDYKFSDMSNFTIDLKVQRTKDVPLDKVLAKQQIDQYTAQAWFSQDKKLEEKVAKISMQTGVVSEYTRMILLETVEEKHATTSSGVKQGKKESVVPPQKVEVTKKSQMIKVLPHLGVGFGNLIATMENTPPGYEPKLPDQAEMLVRAAGNCCVNLCSKCCCLCCIQACSQVNDQCAIVVTQLCTGLAFLGCFACCELCCGQD